MVDGLCMSRDKFIKLVACIHICIQFVECRLYMIQTCYFYIGVIIDSAVRSFNMHRFTLTTS